jgi:hypothetical protein
MVDPATQRGRRGLTRRELIGASAVVAWTAPILLDSIASPAAAASGGLPTGCSYGFVVFTYSDHTYIMKIAQGSASCSFDNSTSNDSDMGTPEFPCGTHSYTGGNLHNNQIWQDGGPVSDAFPGPLTCDDLFSISGSTITRKTTAVDIIFGVSHHGGSGGWNGSKFFPVCPASSRSITLDCG